MADRSPNHRRELGRYFALAQVGLEMVVPVAIGVFRDNRVGWAPWGVVVGAVLGLAGGLAHLVHLANRYEPRDSPPKQDSP
jgi:ATP synthase protein I